MSTLRNRTVQDSSEVGIPVVAHQRIESLADSSKPAVHSEDVSQYRQRLFGAGMRLLAGCVGLVLLTIYGPYHASLLGGLIGYFVFSTLFVVLLLKNKYTEKPLLIYASLSTDVLLIGGIVYALGSQTTPLVSFFFIMVVAYTLTTKAKYGKAAMLLCIAVYGSILLLEYLGVIPIAPLEKQPEGLPDFIVFTVGMVATWGLLDSSIRRLRKKTESEHRLLKTEREARQREALLQQRLAQTERLESVGRLAGGVAHDFNNLLTGILGFAQLIRQDMLSQQGETEDIDEIIHGAQRARDLTSQLLAIGRKQFVVPKVLDLNQIIAKMERMFERIVGSQIKVQLSLDPDLWLIEADQTQIERVMMNLVVNARDAMQQGGNLTIETRNFQLDERSCQDKPKRRPGTYVRLIIRDTGIGMDRSTQSRIFEPFFSTKSSQKGSGLGLATVYGIVRQARGHISVESISEVGTTFIVDLPCAKAAVAKTDKRKPVRKKGPECVFVVDDEDGVRRLIQMLLSRQGYQVFVAASAEQALEMIPAVADQIDLLLTDVVMPGKSGRELVDQVNQQLPGIRHVFMSGYDHCIISQHGVLSSTTRFLHKPFTADELLQCIRDSLR